MRGSPIFQSRLVAVRLAPIVAGMVLACASLAGDERASDRIEIQTGSGWVSITADEAPLVEVLQRLAGAVGMKLVYGGTPPVRPVSVALVRQPASDAVIALLSGQGIDFALRRDGTEATAFTLFVAGATEGASPLPDAVAAPNAADPAPAEEEVDEPENPIDLPEVDPIAETASEPPEEPVPAPRPAASPTPLPDLPRWSTVPAPPPPVAESPVPVPSTPAPADETRPRLVARRRRPRRRLVRRWEPLAPDR
jgi:hypothetical protein